MVPFAFLTTDLSMIVMKGATKKDVVKAEKTSKPKANPILLFYMGCCSVVKLIMEVVG